MRKNVNNNYFYEMNRKIENFPTTLIENFEKHKFNDYADWVLKHGGRYLVDFANKVVSMNSTPSINRGLLNRLLYDGVIESTIHALKAYQDSLMTTNYSNIQRYEKIKFIGQPDSYELEKMGIELKCTIWVKRNIYTTGEPSAYIAISMVNTEDICDNTSYGGFLKYILYESIK